MARVNCPFVISGYLLFGLTVLGCFTGVENTERRLETTRKLQKYGLELFVRADENPEMQLSQIAMKLQQPKGLSVSIHNGKLGIKSLENHVLLVEPPNTDEKECSFLLLTRFDRRSGFENVVIFFEPRRNTWLRILTDDEMQSLLACKDSDQMLRFLLKVQEYPVNNLDSED
jgi:hypothetical protein